MVVGGGIAGMEVARVAAMRGHKVTIYEKTDKLGGHVIAGGVPDLKKDDERLLNWYKNELKHLNIDVKFGVEVTSELIEKEKVEALEDLMLSGKPVPHANRIMLIDLLKMQGVKVLTETYLSEINEKGIEIIDKKHKKTTIPSHTVVLAVGYASENKLYHSLLDKIPELYLIGDAREASNILNAVWDAYEVGRNI